MSVGKSWSSWATWSNWKQWRCCKKDAVLMVHKIVLNNIPVHARMNVTTDAYMHGLWSLVYHRVHQVYLGLLVQQELREGGELLAPRVSKEDQGTQ